LPVPSAVDEIFAWMDKGQVRFKMVVLKVFSLLPYPVPESDGLTSTGLKSWTAVWPETVEAAAAMHTAARLCRKTDLLILRKNSYPYSAVRPAKRQLGAPAHTGRLKETTIRDYRGNLL
jgi:hypothetical protein